MAFGIHQLTFSLASLLAPANSSTRTASDSPAMEAWNNGAPSCEAPVQSLNKRGKFRSYQKGVVDFGSAWNFRGSVTSGQVGGSWDRGIDSSAFRPVSTAFLLKLTLLWPNADKSGKTARVFVFPLNPPTRLDFQANPKSTRTKPDRSFTRKVIE